MAGIQAKLCLLGLSSTWREILDQDVGRAIQVSVFGMEGDLVRGKGDLSAALDYLELQHDKDAGDPEGNQAVRGPQVHPRFNAGDMAAW